MYTPKSSLLRPLLFALALIMATPCVWAAWDSPPYHYDVITSPIPTRGQQGTAAISAINKSTISGYLNIPGAAADRNQDQYWVTEIDNNGFENATLVTGFSLTSYTTVVGSEAFMGCTKLADVDLAEVTQVGARAFKNCTGLRDLVVPASVTSLGDEVFSGCTNLVVLEVPHSSKLSVRSSTFDGFNKARCTLWVPYGMADTYKNDNAWKGFKAYQELPEHTEFGLAFDLDHTAKTATVYAIRNKVYEGNLYIPSTVSVTGKGSYTVTAVKANAFTHQTKITSISIPWSVVTVGDYAFHNTGAKSINWNASSVTIAGNSFSYNRSLESFTFPYLTEVPDGMFANCRSLAEIEIPASVTSIHQGAFKGCTGLHTLIMRPSNYPSVTMSDNFPTQQIYLYCKQSTYSNFLNRGHWRSSSRKVTIEKMADDAQFTSTFIYTNLASGKCAVRGRLDQQYAGKLKIPTRYGSYKVTTVDDNGFNADMYGYAYDEVELSSGLEKISYQAFRGSAISRVDIPATVTTVGIGAFCNTQLTELTIPEGVTYIWGSVVGDCKRLTSLTLPSTTTELGLSIVAGCDNLATLNIKAATAPTTSYGNFGDAEHYTFGDFDKSKCVLNVPQGSRASYMANEDYHGFKGMNEVTDWDSLGGEPGDVNGDGTVNASDVSLLINMIIGGAASSSAGDINGDGTVNASDVSLLINMIIGG